jgi:hypothetical protein
MMHRNEFIKLVEALLQAVKDELLSPEDFMARLNERYGV